MEEYVPEQSRQEILSPLLGYCDFGSSNLEEISGATMSEEDSDGIPELVSSDSEEENIDTSVKSNNDIAANWLSKSPKFLEMQDRDIRIFCFGPVLFVITDVLSPQWIDALGTVGLILNDKRGKELLGFEWKEWALINLMDAAAEELQQILRDKENLVKLLDILDRIEVDNKLDINLGIRLIGNIAGLETNLFKKPVCEGKEKQARFAVLYIGRIYKKHVVGLCKESKDMAVEMKTSLRSSLSVETAERNKDLGNKEYEQGQYEKAVDYYSRAAMADCLNHIYFGNRAQAFNKLHRYRDGLADGRRCIVLKPDWYKGHFRYAQAYFGLNKFEMALEANKNGQTLCGKSKNVSHNLTELVEQGKKFRNEIENKHVLEAAAKIREKVADIEGNKLTTIHDDDVPELVSDSDGETELHNSVASKRRGSKEKSRAEANMKTNEEVPSVKKSLTTSNVKPSSSSKSKQEPASTKPASTPPSTEPALAQPSVIPKASYYKDEVKHFMTEGSNLLCKGVGKGAMYSYQKALDMIAHSNYKTVGIDEEDHVVLKYAWGMAAITSGLYKPILESLEKFVDITKTHISIKFPLAYFGIGKAYIALNRYQEAKDPIRTGSVIASNLKLVQLMWPGTCLEIEESTSKVLKRTLQNMYMLAKYPPQCDAQCRFHRDDEDSRKVIYYTDPNFKGFVRIICDDFCVIEFHHQCWKVYKSTYGEKTHDKDIVDSACPTPGCTALILKIIIIRQDSVQSKEIVSDKPRPKIIKQKRPMLKMKLSSAHKIARREEQKQIRKQKRRERDDFMDTVDDMIDNLKDDQVAAVSEEPVPKAAHSTNPNVFVLKKDEDDPAEKYKGIKQKQPKMKKKKEKVRQVVNVEVNFTDQKEKFLLNECSVDDEVQQTWAPVGPVMDSNPFTVPSSLQESVAQFEHSYVRKPFTTTHDDITENLFSFFEDLLQATGPVSIEDSRITQELDVFPEEAKKTIEDAGGLGGFLSQSLKFAMFENFVCLLKDASRAKQFAEFSKERDENNFVNNSLEDSDNRPYNSRGFELMAPLSLNPHASEFHPVDNSWQTVSHGKHSQKFSKDDNFQKNLNEDSLHLTNRFSSNNNQPLDSRKENDFDEEISKIDDFSLNDDIDQNIEKGDSDHMTKELGHVSPDQFSFLTESKMDTLDSIDDVPLVAVRKRKKNKLLYNYQSSETGSESVQDGNILSDRESMCSQDDHKAGLNTKPAVEDPVNSRSSSRSDISISDHSELSGIWSNRSKSSSLTKGSVRDLWANSPKGDYASSDQEREKSSPSLNDNFSGISHVNELVSDEACVTTTTMFFSTNSSFQLSASPIYSSPALDSQTQFTNYDPFKNGTEEVDDKMNVPWYDYKTPFDTDYLKNNNDLRSPRSIWANNRNSELSQSTGMSAENFMRHYYESELPKPDDLFPSTTTWSSSDETPAYPVPDFTPLPQPPPLNPISLVQYPSQKNLHSNLSPFVSGRTNSRVGSINKMHQSIQCSVAMTTVGINTDPYEPMHEEYSKLEKQCHILILNLETATAKAHEMTETSKALEVKNKSLEEDVNRLQAEKAKWEQDKSALFEQIQQSRQMMAKKEHLEKEFQSALDTIEKERCKNLDEREKILDEKNLILDSAAEYRRQYVAEAERAKQAEIEILKTQFLQGKQNLERQQKEANQHIRHLTGFAKKHQENQGAMPTQIQQALEYYSMVSKNCESQCSSLSQQVDNQIQQILSGKKLSELSAINLFSIPQPTDGMKALVSTSLPPALVMPGSRSRSGPASSPPQTATPPPMPISIQTNNNGSGDASSVKSDTPQQQLPQKPRPPPMLGMMARPQLTRPPVLGSLAARPPLKAPFPAVRQKVPPVQTVALKNSFEKIIMKLQTMFPERDRMYFTKLIMGLRQRCGGSLSGMTLDDIIAQIKKQIEQQGHTQQSVPSSQQDNIDTETSLKRPLAPPPGLSSSWGFQKQATGNISTQAEVFQEEENPCVICHDEMDNQETTMLVCGHKFHNECIRKWLKEQSTCPNCRIHALLPDDFPHLR